MIDLSDILNEVPSHHRIQLARVLTNPVVGTLWQTCIHRIDAALKQLTVPNQFSATETLNFTIAYRDLIFQRNVYVNLQNITKQLLDQINEEDPT